MKRSLLVLALILSGSSAASAYSPGHPGYGSGYHHPRGPVIVAPPSRGVFVPAPRPRFWGYHRFERPRYWRPWHRPYW